MGWERRAARTPRAARDSARGDYYLWASTTYAESGKLLLKRVIDLLHHGCPPTRRMNRKAVASWSKKRWIDTSVRTPPFFTTEQYWSMQARMMSPGVPTACAASE